MQNTKTALRHTGMQYTVTILGIKEDVFHGQYLKVNLMLLIYFFFQVVFNICLFKSLLFADQVTEKLFKLAREKSVASRTETNYIFLQR